MLQSFRSIFENFPSVKSCSHTLFDFIDLFYNIFYANIIKIAFLTDLKPEDRVGQDADEAEI